MINLIGNYGILFFLFVVCLASLIEIFNNRQINVVVKLIDTLNIIAGTIAITCFFVNRKYFLMFSFLSCVTIIICSVLNGIFRKDFHITHHLIRILIVLALFLMSLI